MVASVLHVAPAVVELEFLMPVRRYNLNDLPPGATPAQWINPPSVVQGNPLPGAGQPTSPSGGGAGVSDLRGYAHAEFRKIKQSMDSVADRLTALDAMSPSWAN